MNSRERVMAAINHKEPDYVPLDSGATPSSGISAIAYNNLKKHMGITDGHTRIFDVVQQVVIPEQNIIDEFGVDVIDIGRVFNEKDSDWYDVTLADGSTGQYPVWFQPIRQENGNYIVVDKEGPRLQKCLLEQPSSIRHISRMWTTTRRIILTWTTRWAKSCGALSCTVRGITQGREASTVN